LVEDLQDAPGDRVDLVDEEGVANVQRGHEAHEGSDLVQLTAYDPYEVGPHALRDRLRERGLAYASRSDEQGVGERLTPELRRPGADLQLLHRMLMSADTSERESPVFRTTRD